MDYSKAPFLGADQKARGLWERDWAKRANYPLLYHSTAHALRTFLVQRSLGY